MKKITALGALTLTTLSLAAPAHADNDSNFGTGINATNNFTAAAVCLTEVAVVPVLGNWAGNHANNCSNGNVIDHS